jgi:uncharacterized protein YndB with AHSA1/START domain
MKTTSLTVHAKIQIAKTPAQVFEAIVNPEQMVNYFISQSTGRMEEGKTLIWKFPEFEGEDPVHISKIEKDKLISFYWDINGKQHLTEITLTPAAGGHTIVSIIETGGNNDEAGINWLKGNTEGWANFLACLKAWLEYGINLRKGTFEFMKKN